MNDYSISRLYPANVYDHEKQTLIKDHEYNLGLIADVNGVEIHSIDHTWTDETVPVAGIPVQKIRLTSIANTTNNNEVIA